MNSPALTPKLSSLTRENVTAVDEYYERSQPNTGRSEWSVNSGGTEEVWNGCDCLLCVAVSNSDSQVIVNCPVGEVSCSRSVQLPPQATSEGLPAAV